MLRTVAGFGRPNNHREVNQRMAKTDARSPRTERGTIALQDASQDIWDKKYRLKSKDGTPVDASVDGTWQRVARVLADVEEKASREHWYGRFLWALRNGAIPPAGSSPMPAPWGTSRPPRLSTAPCPEPSRTPWTTSSRKSTRPA